MFRWTGTKSDSEQQATERDRRSARRTIANLPSLLLSDDSEDNFDDCNDTLGLQLDGENDSTLSDDEMAAELARQKALPVEEANFANGDLVAGGGPWGPSPWRKCNSALSAAPVLLTKERRQLCRQFFV